MGVIMGVHTDTLYVRSGTRGATSVRVITVNFFLFYDGYLSVHNVIFCPLHSLRKRIGTRIIRASIIHHYTQGQLGLEEHLYDTTVYELVNNYLTYYISNLLYLLTSLDYVLLSLNHYHDFALGLYLTTYLLNYSLFDLLLNLGH